mgnify:CR=1 FL=1
MITLNPNYLLSTVAGIQDIDPSILLEDNEFRRQFKHFAEYGNFNLAVECLCSYIQDNY